MRIAFFACNRNPQLFKSDPSYIYRCESLGLELIKLGHQVCFCHINDPIKYQGFDVVVFHRPKNLWRTWLLVKYFRLRGAKIWADFDDLIFDINFAEFSPGFVNGLNALRKSKKIYSSHQSALGFFDRFTVSTEPLKQHLNLLSPSKIVAVIPNAVHYRWQENLADFEPRKIDFSQPILSYLPGTRSHDKDFKLIALGLAEFLKKHEQVKLEITGPLSFQLGQELAEQVVHYERVAFSHFHERFKNTWVNLAPLEQTPFNRCKSALKVLEASYWGKPTLCSPIPDALRYQEAGAVLIETPEDICTKLSLLLDPSYYAATTQNLRKKALEVSSIQQAAQVFLDLALLR